jgi:hypothetical protein
VDEGYQFSQKAKRAVFDKTNPWVGGSPWGPWGQIHRMVWSPFLEVVLIQVREELRSLVEEDRA